MTAAAIAIFFLCALLGFGLVWRMRGNSLFLTFRYRVSELFARFFWEPLRSARRVFGLQRQRADKHPETEFGRVLRLLGEQAMFSAYVEVGTAAGLGSTRSLMDGIARRRDGAQLWSVECVRSMHLSAVRNWRRAKKKPILLHGVVAPCGEMMTWEEVRCHPMFSTGGYSERRHRKMLAACSAAPPVLDSLPERIDVLTLDGGDFSGFADFQKLRPRARVIVLDNAHTGMKNYFALQELLADDKWRLLLDRPDDHQGWCVFCREDMEGDLQTVFNQAGFSSRKEDGIKLTPDLKIGIGDNRVCYRHPNNQDLCVKVDKPAGLAAKKRGSLLGRLRLLFFGREELSHNEREFSNHLYARKRAGPDFYRFAPRCHGLVLTSEGKGLVFDIVRDSNGRLSPCLADFVRESPAARREAALAMADDLQSFILTNDLRFQFSFHPQHVLVQSRDGETRLVLSDWKGENRELIPISSWFRIFARAKIRRRFGRLRKWIEESEARAI